MRIRWYNRSKVTKEKKMNIHSIQDLRRAHQEARLQRELSKSSDYLTSKQNTIQYSYSSISLNHYDKLFVISLPQLVQYISTYCTENNICESVSLQAKSAKPNVIEGKDYAGNSQYCYNLPITYYAVMNQPNNVARPYFDICTINYSVVSNREDANECLEQIREEALLSAEHQKVNLLTNPVLHLDSYFQEETNLGLSGINASEMLWNSVEAYTKERMQSKKIDNQHTIANLQAENIKLDNCEYELEHI